MRAACDAYLSSLIQLLLILDQRDGIILSELDQLPAEGCKGSLKGGDVVLDPDGLPLEPCERQVNALPVNRVSLEGVDKISPSHGDILLPKKGDILSPKKGDILSPSEQDISRKKGELPRNRTQNEEQNQAQNEARNETVASLTECHLSTEQRPTPRSNISPSAAHTQSMKGVTKSSKISAQTYPSPCNSASATTGSAGQEANNTASDDKSPQNQILPPNVSEHLLYSFRPHLASCAWWISAALAILRYSDHHANEAPSQGPSREMLPKGATRVLEYFADKLKHGLCASGPAEHPGVLGTLAVVNCAVIVHYDSNLVKRLQLAQPRHVAEGFAFAGYATLEEEEFLGGLTRHDLEIVVQRLRSQLCITGEGASFWEVETAKEGPLEMFPPDIRMVWGGLATLLLLAGLISRMRRTPPVVQGPEQSLHPLWPRKGLWKSVIRPSEREQLIKLILRCRDKDGGYGNAFEAEPHAGHTFCAVAALGALDHELPEHERLQTIEWLMSLMETADGGIAGRPNKPSDTCYCWWVLASLEMLHCKRLVGGHQAQQRGVPDERLAQLRAFLGRCITPEGGIAKHPEERGIPLLEGPPCADPFHTYFGLAAISLTQTFGQPPGVQSVWREKHESGLPCDLPELAEINPFFALPQKIISDLFNGALPDLTAAS